MHIPGPTLPKFGPTSMNLEARTANFGYTLIGMMLSGPFKHSRN